MTGRIPARISLAAAVLCCAAPAAWAQSVPHIGYLYPAGGKRGTTVEIEVGGQYLSGVTRAVVSGEGVTARVLKYVRPLSQNQLQMLGRKLGELRSKMAKFGNRRNAQRAIDDEFKIFARAKLRLINFDTKAYNELRKRMSDPKRQLNPQLSETVLLQITFDREAKPGPREVRLKTRGGMTNPMHVFVSQYREYNEVEPNNIKGDDGVLKGVTAGIELPEDLPVVINGQIMPGDIDRFRIDLAEGTRLVAAVDARRLVPYLADAVPGWFQATLRLLDPKGREVAYSDDFRFHPDPLIYYEVPADGTYTLEIKDSIYRGREDFVYRMTVGEIPLVTDVFPLGGRAGRNTFVHLAGWNLPENTIEVSAPKRAPQIMDVTVRRGRLTSNPVPFAVDDLPECLESEPNDKAPRDVTLPTIVNGRIDKPGDVDVFRFQGTKGQQIAAEVQARRLASPLDSLLTLTDPAGKLLAANDDWDDKSAGLVTHQADSRIRFTLPADGAYLLHLADTQHKGGKEYAYRLRISPCRADFALRVVPSAINTPSGTPVPITVFALRKDGFDGEISLHLKNPPKGFTLSGARIPAGRDKIRLTLTPGYVPTTRRGGSTVRLEMEGRATFEGRQVRRDAVPAEDMMQAFIYRHLVPTDGWLISVTGRASGSGLRAAEAERAKLPVGGVGQIRLVGSNPAYMKTLHLKLSDPPKGVAIKKLDRGDKTASFWISVDAKEAKAGLQGNLIVTASYDRTYENKEGKKYTRRIALGHLPAIPFELVGGAATTAAK